LLLSKDIDLLGVGKDMDSICFEYPSLFKLTLSPLCKVLKDYICALVIQLELLYSLLKHSLMALLRSQSYKSKDCII
jgi:hypothetical protein